MAHETTDGGALARGAPPTDTMRWIGSGGTAFIGSAGHGHELAPRKFSSLDAIERAYGGAGGDSTPLHRALESYFACGGRECYVVNAPGLAQLSTEPEVASFLGEDGGPGYRSGLQSLNELDDLGTIAVPGRVAPLVSRVLAEFVAHRRALGLVLDRSDDERHGAETSRGEFVNDPDEHRRVASRAVELERRAIDSLERVAWVDGEDPRVAKHASALGVALGRLDAWERENGEHAGLPPSPIDIPVSGGRFGTLGAWRRWEGLRRSLDIGTRWVLFEIQGPFLRPRVEREIRAFLYRLHRVGFFPPGSSDENFRVSCDVSMIEGRRGATGKLRIRVRARVFSGRASQTVPVEWSENEMNRNVD